MPIYQIKLLERKEIAANTIELTFEKPQNFNYLPGQYGGFTLINPTKTDAKGSTRRFSFISTPDENVISIVTRLQGSAFKQVLNEMDMGSVIKFAGPSGAFTLHDDATIPAVFLAGGIGIAPFYSMLKFTAKHHPERIIYLFYGNQTSKDSAYLTELQNIKKSWPQFFLITTMDRPDISWQGETGFINSNMVHKYVKELDQAIYYVCGSGLMVNAVHNELRELEISEERIKMEDFPGY